MFLPICRPGREDPAIEAECPGHFHVGRSGRGSRPPNQVPVRWAGQALHCGFPAGPLLWRLIAHAVFHKWFVFWFFRHIKFHKMSVKPDEDFHPCSGCSDWQNQPLWESVGRQSSELRAPEMKSKKKLDIYAVKTTHISVLFNIRCLQVTLRSRTRTVTPTWRPRWCLCSSLWQRSCLWGPATWRRSSRTAVTRRRPWSCSASAAGRTLSSPPLCLVSYSGR